MPSFDVLNVVDECAPLTDLGVCLGTSVPDYGTYVNDHPEFAKYRIRPWDREKLLEQQRRLWDVFERYDVSLHFFEECSELPWQMYTRDTGFVIGDKLFYSDDRPLPERHGEIGVAIESLASVDQQRVVELTSGPIEGGDVLVHDGMVFVGQSARTGAPATAELGQHHEVVTLRLGPSVMHLDTRMTILPGRRLLIHTPAFTDDDLAVLRRQFSFIEVTDDEQASLGTNIVVINPETIVLHQGHGRIADELSDVGLHVERIDYSEPIAIAGSFRCTTMPLARS